MRGEEGATIRPQHGWSRWQTPWIAWLWAICIALVSACEGSIAGPEAGGALETQIGAQFPLDDSSLSMNTQGDIEPKRKRILDLLFGDEGFPPARMPESVEKDVASPVQSVPLTNLARVDRLVVDLGQGMKNELFHFIPSLPNGELVVVHQGHSPTFDDLGEAGTIAALLADGYGVLGTFMPCFSSFPCPIVATLPGDPHDDLGNQIQVPAGSGNTLKYFVEHVAIGLQYLRTKASDDGFLPYTRFHMTGVSGGGWTTVLYAAIDPTITVSVPVSGSKPLYLQRCPGCLHGFDGDFEQDAAPLYEIAGYLDLYALGSAGAGRRQVQVQIRHDACCFGEDNYNGFNGVPGLTWIEAVRGYEQKVQAFFRGNSDSGWFRFEVDETSSGLHRISPATQAQVLLAELDGHRRAFAVNSALDAYTRGADGTLVHQPPSWLSLPSTVVGAPSVVSDADIVLRDAASQAVRLSKGPGGWSANALPGHLSTEPAAVSTGDRLDVVAIREDSRLWHWAVSDAATVMDHADPTTEVVGVPALVAAGSTQLDAFALRTDAGMQHVFLRGDVWSTERVGTLEFRGFPAAVIAPDSSVRLYARGTAGELWEATSEDDQSGWSLVSLGEAPGVPSVRIAGSPSAIVDGSGTILVAARTLSGDLAVLAGSQAASGTTWSTRPVAATDVSLQLGLTRFADSPVVVAGDVFALGVERGLWSDSFSSGWSRVSPIVH